MGVPLGRAWEICALLDEADGDGRWDYELARATYLTDPANKAQEVRRLAPRLPPPRINPETVERDRRARRRRLGLG